MEIFTERLRLKDILPEKAKDIAKKYHFKEEDIEFIRKNNPLNAEDLQIEDGERAAIRYINTADVDRDGEIVLPSGGQLDDFRKSSAVLYAHNYQGLPIGRDAWIKLIKGKGILAKTLYATHQLAEDVYNLVKGMFLNTSSIGFIPLESVQPNDKDWGKVKEKVKSEYGINEKLIDKAKRIYTKWILLEHSDVPIPSNMNALNIAVGKGFEIKSQELIDDLEIEIIDDEEEEKNIINKPEETDDYIRIPVRDCKVTATITISEKEGIKALYCGKIKKIRTYLFAKAKGWTMEKAKKWVADHGKEYDDIDIKDFEVEEDNETHQPKTEEKKEPSKGFSIDEIYEIVKENKELIEKLAEIELKAGAVLNKKNKSDLKEAQAKIQNVLDSAETVEPLEDSKQSFNCECIKCGYKQTSDKHCDTLKCPKCGGEMRRAERPGPGKESGEIIIEDDDIEIEEIKEKEKESNEIDVEVLTEALSNFYKTFQGEIKRQNEELYKYAGNKMYELADMIYKKMKGKIL